MRLFYKPDIEQNTTLSVEESKHCIKVLRMQQGDDVEIIDGKGNSFFCKIKDANPKKCLVNIVNKVTHDKLPYIHIAISPTKNIDRIEWFVEKAVEIGISEISFIITKQSERKQIKTERIVRIAISAMKQSHKYYLPKINTIERFSDFIKKPKKGIKLIANQTEGKINYITNHKNNIDGFTIIIGPEGDFDNTEIDLAKENDFQAISLGKHRLRTETAGLYACMEANLVNR